MRNDFTGACDLASAHAHPGGRRRDATDLCVTLAAELSAPGLDADDPAVEEHSLVATGGL